MIMYKVTNSGVWEKMVFKVTKNAVFYFRTKKIDGKIRSQKELKNTSGHDWFDSKKEADKSYEQRVSRK